MAAVKPMSTEEDEAVVPVSPKPSAKPKKQKKRTYRRRDMRAE